jgi:hypothetical protein
VVCDLGCDLGGDLGGGGELGGDLGVMPKVNLKNHFKKIMLTLRHVFSVGM